MVAETLTPEKFGALSPAQFFARYREIAGFSNPKRALYQTVRELVENALDATDSHGILPNIKIVIRRSPENPSHYTITVEDNGIGIPPQHVPNAFGRVLYSSKYVLRQTRGMFGLGVKAAIIYGQMTTGNPVEIITSTISSKRIYYFKLRIDLKKNQPVILERGSWRKNRDWHGTIASITVEGDWSRAKRNIIEYIRRTAIVTPYANIVFVSPDGEIMYYKRTITKVPIPPKIVKPHPHGIDLELLKEMIKHNSERTIKDFLINSFHGIGYKTVDELLQLIKINKDKKVGSLTEDEIKKLAKILRGIDREVILQFKDSGKYKTLLKMLQEAFPWLSKEKIIQAIEYVNKILVDKTKQPERLSSKFDPTKLKIEHIDALVRALKKYYPRIRPPSPSALSPLGEEIIIEGLKRVYEPEFIAAVTRKPLSYQGHPFIIEVGIAYGGKISDSDKPVLVRFANRIPLIYDESSDVAWKVVKPRRDEKDKKGKKEKKEKEGFDWKAYGIEFPAPLIVFTHICSTKIPFKGVGKESVADVPEIENELKLALREVARRLRIYILKKKKEEEKRRRITILARYVPEIARNLSIILRDIMGTDGIEPLLREKLIEAIAVRTGIDKMKIMKAIEDVGIET